MAKCEFFLNYVLGNMFASKTLRNTIVLSTPMLSVSRNQMMLNKRFMYDTFSRWPPYKYKKQRFRPQFRPRIRNTSLCDGVLVDYFQIHLYLI